MESVKLVSAVAVFVGVGLTIVALTFNGDRKSTFFGELKGRLLQAGISLAGTAMASLPLFN